MFIDREAMKRVDMCYNSDKHTKEFGDQFRENTYSDINEFKMHMGLYADTIRSRHSLTSHAIEEN